MRQLGYDPFDLSLDATTPQGVGNLAARTVLTARHKDGSNQLGTLTPNGTPYADYTGYNPANPPSPVPVLPGLVLDVNRWQPLLYADATGAWVTQKYLAPFWGLVTPFAMKSGAAFRDLIARFGPMQSTDPAFRAQAEELVDISANLTDRQKMIAEYWADGPHSETPPGHWELFAQFVSNRDRHTADDDAKMFFAMANAIMDAGIAVWDAKRVFDSARPVSVIPYMFKGQTIRSWGGPGRGAISMDGSSWIPYQASAFPSPPFPEFVSGHSAFSAAAAEILRLFCRGDRFGAEVAFEPGSSHYEPGSTPLKTVSLRWLTFSAAADEAGMSRRYGGIHFKAGDLAGRAVGRAVAFTAWKKASLLWEGVPPYQR
jgi:membrane-associated phospholipid phosphatase